MNVAQLIDQLRDCPANSEVFLWCDHGQNAEDATSVELYSQDSVWQQYEIEVDDPAVVIYGL